MSYEALRNYHYDREPPPSYLARVAEVFEVRLAWLVAGEGDMTEEEEGVERISEAALRDAEGDPEWKRRVRFKWDVHAGLGVSPPDLEPIPYRTDEEGRIDPEDAAKVFRAWAESVNASHIPHWLPPLLEAGRRLGVDGKTLGKALRGPLAALDLDADAMTKDQLGDYISAMVPVLLTLESHTEEED